MIENLRAHIKRSSHNGLEDGVVSVVEVSCESKVADFKSSCIDEDVSWFEVSMHNIQLIQVFKSSHNIFEEVQGLRLWQSSSFFEVAPKVSFFAELSY